MESLIQTVAVVCWHKHDALALAIGSEIEQTGRTPVYFLFNDPPPLDANLVLTFAPYGRWMQIPHALATRQPRPLLLHWNTENPPDLRLPWTVVKTIGALRAGIDRMHDAPSPAVQKSLNLPPLKALDTRLTKFRYMGEYHYTAQRGWLDVYAESSEIYGKLHAAHGLPTKIVPWGTVPAWSADLGLERDIDVLWFGLRRSKRRSQLLDRVRSELLARGIKIVVLDGVEQPFVHGAARTKLLNRAKVTLNLLPTWYDHAFPYRFHVAAGNRSLVVTEPMLPHSLLYKEGTHYVSAPVAQLADTIVYCLQHEPERRAIAEQAHELVMTRMTMGHSIRALMEHAEAARKNR